MDDKKLDECVEKVLEYCSAELCLSAPEVVDVLDKACCQADDMLTEKTWAESQ
jgi:hypothetical protein